MADKTANKMKLYPLMWMVLGLTVASIIIFVTAMLIPPTGEVHPSVLKGMAIVTADIALINFAYAIATGKTATFSHGKTKATIGTKKQE